MSKSVVICVIFVEIVIKKYFNNLFQKFVIIFD